MTKQLQQFKEQIENGRLVQSFLIVGPEKTGKFDTVVKMAGLLNNFNDEQIRSARRGEIADVILVETEISKNKTENNKRGNNIKNRESQTTKSKKQIESVNRLKTRKLKDSITKENIDDVMTSINLKNFQFQKKVLIIKEANKMTNTAVNSLLKLIEEPNKDLIIFLLVNNEDEILATVKSRCQIIRFSFEKNDKIGEFIKRNYANIKDKDLQDIIALSGGRIELANEYATDIKKIKKAKEMRDKFRKALRGGKIEQIKLVDELVKNEENFLWVINEWIWYLKDFLEKNIQDGQSIAVIKKIHTILKELLNTRDIIQSSNVSKKVQLENFFVQI